MIVPVSLQLIPGELLRDCPNPISFGNICMINISQIFDKAYEGKSVYYVDDSYIYTDQKINDEKDFRKTAAKD